ncbi:MAG TPA: M23 family metallopeptidase [Candidatus Limnocylindrales bacterium]|nr:M23 family metallopeptidase [Candidatus Limnocylindrales bacterium]
MLGAALLGIAPLQGVDLRLFGAADSARAALPPSTAARPHRPVPDADTVHARKTARPTAPSPRTLKGYQWPLVRGRLTQRYGVSSFGSAVVGGRPFHDGIDLATFCGDRIVAAHAGVVIAAGRHFDDYIGWQGNLARYKANLDRKGAWSILPIVLVIDDGNGYRSVYAHFESLAVKRGDHVRAGQFIGREGATGHASGCHLHYGLFSPWETKLFGLKRSVAERLKLPGIYTARINPLLVMPWRLAPPPKRR